MTRDVGRFLELDGEGFFRSAAAGAGVQEDWRLPLGPFVAACQREAGAAFHSFYVRGSVACGTAVKGSSDLDTVLVLDDGAGERRPEWQHPLAARLIESHPFVTDVEVVVLGRGALLAAARAPGAADPVLAQWCFLLALWGRCFGGADLLPELGRFRPGREVAYVMCSLPVDLRVFERRLAREEPAAERRRLCVWTCKKLLRSGAELAMLDDGRFTRDLGPCTRRFAARLRGHAVDAERLLAWAIAPVADLTELAELAKRLEPVLVREAAAAGLRLENPADRR